MPYRDHMPAQKIELARQMRAEPTAAEARLWEALRTRRPGGAPWARQVPMLGYIADFYCAQRRLVVEADGSSHRDRAAADRLRDQVMFVNGISVLRFRNEEIIANLPGVLRTIAAAPAGVAPPKGARRYVAAPPSGLPWGGLSRAIGRLLGWGPKNRQG